MSDTVGYLIGIFGPILFWVGFIALCVYISKRRKKNKVKKAIKEEWNKTIALYSSSKKEYFKKIYNELLKDVDKVELSQSLRNISDLKREYEKALKKLSLICDNNTVFLNSQQERRNFEERMLGVNTFEENDIITEDIIKTLPSLAEFVDIYNKLMEKNYQLLQVDYIYFSSWRCLDQDRYYSEDNEEFLHSTYLSCYEMVGQVYNSVMQEEWNNIIRKFPTYSDHIFEVFFFESMHDSQGLDKWMEIWKEQLEIIAQNDLYYPIQKDLEDFLDSMEEKYKLFDRDLLGLNLCEYSSFNIGKLSDYNSDEIMRIYELYLSGKMRGRYYKENDPKYKNN